MKNRISLYMINIWCGNNKPEKIIGFLGTRREARAKCREYRIKPKPFIRGSAQIAHERWMWFHPQVA